MPVKHESQKGFANEVVSCRLFEKEHIAPVGIVHLSKEEDQIMLSCAYLLFQANIPHEPFQAVVAPPFGLYSLRCGHPSVIHEAASREGDQVHEHEGRHTKMEKRDTTFL